MSTKSSFARTNVLRPTLEKNGAREQNGKEIEMVVEKKLNNCHDSYAMVIKMTLLLNIPREFHDKVTGEAKGNAPEQRVKDIADKVVARVPANLCKLFLHVLDKREVSKITCIASDHQYYARFRHPINHFFTTKEDMTVEVGVRLYHASFTCGATILPMIMFINILQRPSTALFSRQRSHREKL